jgi:SAM-dependent methyltransferase
MVDPKPHPASAYFEPIGDRLGRAYLRYDFTKGTSQEVAFLLDLVGPGEGRRLLDVGCGPGRHAVPLAHAGWAVTGIDVSQAFLDIAAVDARSAGVGLSLFQVDARQMPFDNEFVCTISICQGGFGLMGRDDALVLRRMAEATAPGGTVILTAFSSYYSVREQRDAHLDVDSGVVHEVTTIRDEAGKAHQVDLWTGVYTPRELRLLALGVGLVPEEIWSVAPGDFARRPPDLDHPEFMMVASKPA